MSQDALLVIPLIDTHGANLCSAELQTGTWFAPDFQPQKPDEWRYLKCAVGASPNTPNSQLTDRVTEIQTSPSNPSPETLISYFSWV